MSRSQIIPLWFTREKLAVLLDYRSIFAAAHDLDEPERPGWRIVLKAGLSQPPMPAEEDSSADPTSTIHAWPPFYPIDLPLSFNLGHLPRRFQVVDFSAGIRRSKHPLEPIEFVFDPSLKLDEAHSFWVLSCLNPDRAWRHGLFGSASWFDQHAVKTNEGDLVDELVSRTVKTIPGTQISKNFLISPIAGNRVGSTVPAQRQENSIKMVVGIEFEDRPDGISQPVVVIESSSGSTLGDVQTKLECFIFSRHTIQAGRPSFEKAELSIEPEGEPFNRMIFTLSEPIFHGDVIALRCQDVELILSPKLNLVTSMIIERHHGWNIALFLRRESSVDAVTNDSALANSDHISFIYDEISGQPPDEGSFTELLKEHVKSILRRSAVATSYLLDDTSSRSAIRSEIDQLLQANSDAELANLALTAASPKRMAELYRYRQPFDQPWRNVKGSSISSPEIFDCLDALIDIDQAST